MGYIEDLRELVGHRPLILVGAVTIIMDNENRILLQKRKASSGRWGIPGGLMELGETAEETARREVLEETGLTVGKLNLIDVLSGQENFLKVSNGDEFYAVTIAFYTNEISGSLKVDKSESFGFEFFHINELPSDIVKSHRKIIDRFLEKYDYKEKLS